MSSLTTAVPLPPVVPVEGGAASAAWVLVALPALGALVLFLGGKRTDKWGHLLGVATVVAVVPVRRGALRRVAGAARGRAGP